MDGIIVINKPKEFTSHDVVAIVRKTINRKEKCGHIGTLDPNATGVLPILIGKATKASKYLIEHNKTYIAKLKLGEKKSTADETGDTIEIQDVHDFAESDIKNVLKTFLGESMQIPPIYSAIKVNGKKLYEYARNGEKVEIAPRKINIVSLNFLEFNKEKNEITFEVECSKGTYIRTLCEEIAIKLGTIGYMKELERTKVDSFKIKTALDLESLTIDKVQENLISLDKIFKNKEKINLDSKELNLFLNGVLLNKNIENDVYKIYNNNKFIGLGIVKDKLLKRDIIL